LVKLPASVIPVETITLVIPHPLLRTTTTADRLQAAVTTTGTGTAGMTAIMTVMIVAGIPPLLLMTAMIVLRMTEPLPMTMDAVLTGK